MFTNPEKQERYERAYHERLEKYREYHVSLEHAQSGRIYNDQHWPQVLEQWNDEMRPGICRIFERTMHSSGQWRRAMLLSLLITAVWIIHLFNTDGFTPYVFDWTRDTYGIIGLSFVLMLLISPDTKRREDAQDYSLAIRIVVAETFRRKRELQELLLHYDRFAVSVRAMYFIAEDIMFVHLQLAELEKLCRASTDGVIVSETMTLLGVIMENLMQGNSDITRSYNLLLDLFALQAPTEQERQVLREQHRTIT